MVYAFYYVYNILNIAFPNFPDMSVKVYISMI